MRYSKNMAPGETGAFFGLEKVAPALVVMVKEDKKHHNKNRGLFAQVTCPVTHYRTRSIWFSLYQASFPDLFTYLP